MIAKAATMRRIRFCISMSASLACIALVGCSAYRKDLDDTDLSYLAQIRCLVDTGLFTKKQAEALPEFLADKHKNNDQIDADWRMMYKKISNAMRHGLSDEEYRRLLQTPEMKDCHATATTWMVTNLSRETAALAAVRLGKNWFDGKKSTRTLPELIK